MRGRSEKAVLCLTACVTLFQCTPQGAPVTAVVFPRVLEQRSDGGELLVAIRDNQTLRLRKASVLRRELDVTTFEGDKEVVHYMNGARIERDLYHDPEAHAVLVLTRGKRLRLFGIIGPTERIQPSPPTELHTGRGVKHEILRIVARDLNVKDTSGTIAQGTGAGLSMALTDKQTRAKNNPEGRSGTGPYPINSTCETRIAVDSTFFNAFKAEKEELVQYIAVLIAFVNLKLQTFQDNILRLQVVVTGIIIYSEEKETFIERWKQNRFFMLDSTLYNFNLYASKEDRFKNDDIAVLITGLNLAGRYSNSPRVNEDIVGIATVRGACGFYKTALVEDIPRTFSSVHTTAHEIGHLLGAQHDGSERKPNSPSQVDPTMCPAGAKNIMTPSLGPRTRHDFSYCSTAQVAEFILSNGGHCLTTAVKIPTVKLTFDAVNHTRTSLTEFCKRHHHKTAEVYSQPGKYGPDNCFISCEIPGPPRKLAVNDAPDGTPCSAVHKRKICLNGECTRTKLKPVGTVSDSVKNSVEEM
ncbi:venom metalloproteinase BumaMPs1-like isoform X2 [Amblyomma americanum]